MQKALAEHPELWDQNTTRTKGYGPHARVSDIWVRYNSIENLDKGDFNGEHDSVWYPAAKVLPVRPLLFGLMREVEGERLGGVLITRIPAGANVEPHIDQGWHARYYEKFALQIQAAEGQQFCFEDERLVTRTGDLFTFNNAYTHWVTNASDTDRITMICCIRRSS